MVFFKKNRKEYANNDIREHCFFIPIVQQIKACDCNSELTWGLVNQENILRKFYSSEELLYQKERVRLPKNSTLSCYKIYLTESERQQLTVTGDNNTIFTGYLNFQMADIESLVVFGRENRIEHPNPFYPQEDQVARCGAA